ncbi:SpoIIE family protein phosphatase [Georgenia muralis]
MVNPAGGAHARTGSTDARPGAPGPDADPGTDDLLDLTRLPTPEGDRPGFRADEYWALTVLKQMPQAVVVLANRPGGRTEIVAANQAVTVLTGFTRSQMITGAHDLRAVAGVSPESERSIAEVLAAGEAAALTLSATHADGSQYWVALELAPMSAHPSEEELWVGVMRDVSLEVENAHLERVRLEMERRARLGLALVARVSDLLQETDASDVLRTIAELLTRQVVAWAGFFVLGRTLQEVNGTSPDPAAPVPPELDTTGDPVLELLQTLRMRTVELAPDTPAEEGTVTAQLLAQVAPHLRGNDDAEQKILVLPVLGRRRTLALLVAVPRHVPPAFADSADLEEPPALRDETDTVLELVARRVGMAMDNVQLYAREHLLAETLQRAMLPEQADVEGLEVWTYYAPNAEHAQVGGDWYDVVNLKDDVVAVVIGDVVGHDVEAAAAMGQLRSVVRAYAAELVDPATVLGRVDSLVNGMRIPRTASLVYATLTPRDDECWDFAYSRAGHLPPLRVRSGEVTTLDGAGGSLVGFGTGQRQTATVMVEPGDVIVLYTDGLVERRDRTMREGLEALVELCRSVPSIDVAGVGEEILQLADAPEDDVAMVVIRVPGGPDGQVDQAAPRRRRWQMPVDATSIGRARHAVRRACATWGIENVGAAELVVSELMANAVMHGWGRIGLRLQDTGDGLRIEVEDANPAPPITRERHTARVGGFGMHIVDRLADWGWRPTPGGKVVWARLRSEPAATEAR